VLIDDFGMKWPTKLKLGSLEEAHAMTDVEGDGFEELGCKGKMVFTIQKDIFVCFVNFGGVPRTTWRCRKKQSELW